MGLFLNSAAPPLRGILACPSAHEKNYYANEYLSMILTIVLLYSYSLLMDFLTKIPNLPFIADQQLSMHINRSC